VRDQDREDGALLRAAELERLAVVEDLEGPEDAELHPWGFFSRSLARWRRVVLGTSGRSGVLGG
jgi:hypothetical protein